MSFIADAIEASPSDDFTGDEKDYDLNENSLSTQCSLRLNEDVKNDNFTLYGILFTQKLILATINILHFFEMLNGKVNIFFNSTI